MATEILLPWTNKDMAGTIRVKFAEHELTADIRKIYARRLDLLGETLKTQIQRNISKSGMSSPSSPGEYPRRLTGRLINSIFFTVDRTNLVLLVGTNLKYGLWLEFGTAGGRVIVPKKGRMLRWFDRREGVWRFARRVVQGPIKKRSFLRRTFFERRSTIKTIMEAKIPKLKGLPT